MNRDQHMEGFRTASIEQQRQQTMLEGAIKLYRASKPGETERYHMMAHTTLDAILDAERKMAHHLEQATRLLGRD